ncbi:MAG: short-chain dehydrogenase [Gammaproteobacteria bacterium]|nr:MAG: short-chain dehydrogenase [Gammaproteobacteria bacterium]
MVLENQIAVITGGSSGIGEATAKLFASEGAKVVLLARTVTSLDKVAAQIKEAGGIAHTYGLDVANTKDVDELFVKIENDLGAIDILVNCAGVFYQTSGGAMIEQQWRQMLDVNLGGTINTCNAVLPNMRAREKGQIINIASISAVTASSEYSVYCASKAAVAMLSKSLAAEFAPFGVHINIIAPGNTATPINSDIRKQASAMRVIEASTPSKRAFSEPIDIARTALFLCSEGGAPYYGAVFLADEGMSLESEILG